MKFFLDHDIPETVARTLARAGFHIQRLREALDITATDRDVLQHARQHGFVLLTCNRNDFLALSEQQSHAGVIILIRRRTRAAECASLLKLLRSAGEEGIRGNVNFA